MYVLAGLVMLGAEAIGFALNSARTGKFEISIPGLLLAMPLSFLVLPAAGVVIWLFMQFFGFLFPSLRKPRKRRSKAKE